MTDPIQECRARIVGFGEVLLRLASAPPELLFQEMRLETSFCGAEANVMVALAGFGHDVSLVTTLPDNLVGEAAERVLRSFGVEVTAPRVGGSRLGQFFLQPGAMMRPSSITYDRAHSAFATIEPTAYDWQPLLLGADWLFVSGITAALGDNALAALREAMTAARSAGLRIAFDTNHRPTLWHGREEVAAKVMRSLACESDLIFAGRRAAAMMTEGRFDQDDPAEGFAAASQAMFALAPRLQHMAATRREIRSTDRQRLTGLIADRQSVSTTMPADLVGIVDRVGTGDAFAAGVVHGLVEGRSMEATVAFAVACARWAHSVPGDFLRASQADIAAIAAGSLDVQR